MGGSPLKKYKQAGNITIMHTNIATQDLFINAYRNVIGATKTEIQKSNPSSIDTLIPPEIFSCIICA